MAQNLHRGGLKQEIDQTVNQINQARKETSPPITKYSHIPKQSAEFAGYIDHTLLKLDATSEQIDELCEEALAWKFKSVCVRLNYVAQAVKKLEGGGIDVCCVIGFHEGTYTTEEKREEAVNAIRAGAVELDFVINYPLLKAREYWAVYEELKTLREHVYNENKCVLCKLILETSQLTHDEIIAGTFLAYGAGFDFAKTSTGFMGHGARVEDVQLMRHTADFCASNGQRKMSVKASGGIRTLQDALTMLSAGAERLGCSAGVAIMSDKDRLDTVHTTSRTEDKKNTEAETRDGY